MIYFILDQQQTSMAGCVHPALWLQYISGAVAKPEEHNGWLRYEFYKVFDIFCLANGVSKPEIGFKCLWYVKQTISRLIWIYRVI